MALTALSSRPLCVLQRLVLGWHQTCLFSAGPGGRDPGPPCLAPSGASGASLSGLTRQLTAYETRVCWGCGANKGALERPPRLQGPLPWLNKGRHPKSEAWPRGHQERNESRGVQKGDMTLPDRSPDWCVKHHQCLPSKRQQENKV